MNHIIGIDLGTTNCCAAVVVDGKPVVIPTPQGGLVTPSVVSFEDDGTCLVGEPARRRAILHPLRTVCSVKRFMGEAYDNTKELAEAMPYRVARGDNHLPQFDGGTSWLTPQQVSAKILSQIKQNAEAFLGEPVTEAVITVPAYFNDLQRQATKEAGVLAGLKVRRIVAEPTAAALAYGLGKYIRDENVAVFHLGGGTFDISILNIGDGVYEVMSVCGNTCLGGDDFDKAIVDWLVADFQKAHGIDLRHDPTALQRLREAAEKAKCELSSTQEAEINLPFIASSDGIPLSLSCSLSRERFDTLCAGLVEALRQPCRTAIQSARNSHREIGKVLLVGGGTRIPAVQKTVAEIFGINPSMNVNPDEAVAIGAAIQGAILQGAVGETLLLDALPLSYGIETEGGVMTRILDANWVFPTKKTMTFTTTADNQTEVQLRILQGERPMANDNKTIGRVILRDITPAPKGETLIEISFDIDANGILNVNATEKKSGKIISTRIEPGMGITEEDFRHSSVSLWNSINTSSSSDSSSSSSGSSGSSSGAGFSSSTSSNTDKPPYTPPVYNPVSTSSWLDEYGSKILGFFMLVSLILLLVLWVDSCDGDDDSYEDSYHPSYYDGSYTPHLPSSSPLVSPSPLPSTTAIPQALSPIHPYASTIPTLESPLYLDESSRLLQTLREDHERHQLLLDALRNEYVFRKSIQDSLSDELDRRQLRRDALPFVLEGQLMADTSLLKPLETYLKNDLSDFSESPGAPSTDAESPVDNAPDEQEETGETL